MKDSVGMNCSKRNTLTQMASSNTTASNSASNMNRNDPKVVILPFKLDFLASTRQKLDFVRTGAIVRSYHRVMNSTEYATKPLVYRELSFQMQKKTFCNRIAFSDVPKMPSPDVFGKKSLRVAGI